LLELPSAADWRISSRDCTATASPEFDWRSLPAGRRLLESRSARLFLAELVIARSIFDGAMLAPGSFDANGASCRDIDRKIIIPANQYTHAKDDHHATLRIHA